MAIFTPTCMRKSVGGFMFGGSGGLKLVPGIVSVSNDIKKVGRKLKPESGQNSPTPKS